MKSKRKLDELKGELIELENTSVITGGGNHELTFCYSIELYECIREEAEWCGDNVTEVNSKKNPW